MSTEQLAPLRLPAAHQRLRAEALALAGEFSARHREIRLHGLQRGEVHPELWREITSRGWSGLLLGEDHGEGGLLAYVVVLEALAEGNLILWMAVLSAAIAYAIAQVGPDTARARWLEPVAAGESFLALAVTEPGVGHNVFRSQTTVRRDGEGFVLDGVKAVTSGIEQCERVLVLGSVPGEREHGAPRQYTTVLVDPNWPGVQRTELPMRGREGVRQWQLQFKEVKVAADALVGVEGQGLLTLWPFTHIERILTGALAVGNAQYCLARAVGYARERTVFGDRPIGAEQAIGHPLARLHARIQASALLVHRAAAGFDAGADQLAIAGEANMAKLLGAEVLFDAADQLVQTLGASAFDEREGILDLFLDARLARSAPVSQELALNFIAQHVLGLPSHR
ncbi:MAG TPA: acyl-CoA dehydrogenase family protein [Solirubrobacteraceae bacterium]